MKQLKVFRTEHPTGDATDRGGIRRSLAPVVTLLVIVGVILGTYEPVAADPKEIKKCQTITKPGAYQVEKNLSAKGDCLVVEANFVTIDLDGFTITGNGTGRGITDDGVARKGITIRNGTITSFSVGVDLGNGSGHVVEHVRAIANTDGLIVGPRSFVNRNIAVENLRNGIFTDCPSLITSNIARSNGVLNFIQFFGCGSPPLSVFIDNN